MIGIDAHSSALQSSAKTIVTMRLEAGPSGLRNITDDTIGVNTNSGYGLSLIEVDAHLSAYAKK